MKHFILNPSSDNPHGFASIAAIRAYCKVIERYNSMLSERLIKAIHKIEDIEHRKIRNNPKNKFIKSIINAVLK